MVVQDQTEMFLNLNHHPVCAASDASHFFLLAQPPLLARRGDGPVRQRYPHPRVAAKRVIAGAGEC